MFRQDQILSLKYPHSSVNLVGEAMCLLWAKKPSFSNFKSLVGESDFLAKYIRPFNPNTTSDYVLNELATSYIHNEEFAPDKIAAINATAGAMCKWIRCVYEIASRNNLVTFFVNIQSQSWTK